jgi:hypothetical protein
MKKKNHRNSRQWSIPNYVVSGTLQWYEPDTRYTRALVSICSINVVTMVATAGQGSPLVLDKTMLS